MASRRWRRRDQTLHGSSDGSIDRHDQNARHACDVTPELKQTIVEGVLREAGNRSVDELAQQENELIIGLLRSRAQSENSTTKTKQAAT
jgi:hypothetical protein